MARETVWKDEAPPSTAMKNRKKIRRKKRILQSLPFLLFSETRREASSSGVRPLSLSLSLFFSLSLQLASLLLVSVHAKAKKLPFSHQMSPFANNSCWTWHSGWLHDRVRCYTEKRRNTPLDVWLSAEATQAAFWREGKRERESERSGWRDRYGGGSL